MTDKPWLEAVNFGEAPRMKDARAMHTIPVWARAELCRKCTAPAAHKVEETSGPGAFHPLTSYLCCNCFVEVMGPAHGSYPYELYTEDEGDPESELTTEEQEEVYGGPLPEGLTIRRFTEQESEILDRVGDKEAEAQ